MYGFVFLAFLFLVLILVLIYCPVSEIFHRNGFLIGFDETDLTKTTPKGGPTMRKRPLKFHLVPTAA